MKIFVLCNGLKIGFLNFLSEYKGMIKESIRNNHQAKGILKKFKIIAKIENTPNPIPNLIRFLSKKVFEFLRKYVTE